MTPRPPAIVVLAAALIVSAAGCTKGVRFQFISGDPPAAVDPRELEPGRPFRLRLKFQRRTFAYVIEDRPDGSIRSLLPSPAVRGGTDDFTADDSVELPAEGGITAPARLILLAADVPVPGLRQMLIADKPDAGKVRGYLDKLRRAQPHDQTRVLEIREGWTTASLQQMGVDEVLFETLIVGRPAAAP